MRLKYGIGDYSGDDQNSNGGSLHMDQKALITERKI